MIESQLAVVEPETSLKVFEGLVGLAEDFLRSLDIKKNSKRTYREGLKRFVSWITQERIQRPEREDILAYKDFLKEEGKASLTISGYLVAVRKFFEWLEGKKHYPNIARGIKGAKRVRGFRKDPLTVDQARELLGDIDRATPQGKRNFAILNLMIRTGLRTIEIIRADVEDIRQESGEAVLYIQGKGRDAKDEFVLLTEETLKPIREYLQAREETGEKAPLFASLSDRNGGERLTTRSISWIAKKHLRGIGLDDKRLTAHSLRHTALTFSLVGGATLQAAQRLARHSDINTTLIYAHNINRIADAPERKIDAVLAGAG